MLRVAKCLLFFCRYRLHPFKNRNLRSENGNLRSETKKRVRKRCFPESTRDHNLMFAPEVWVNVSREAGSSARYFFLLWVLNGLLHGAQRPCGFERIQEIM